VLTQISAFTYRPFDVTVYGNPMLPLGTAIVLNTKYQTINSFVMNKYMSGIQALRDHLSAVGEQTYPSDVNRIKNEIIRSTGKIHKITNDVNELTSEIYDDQGNSLIQQTLDEIVLKVDSDGNLVQAELGTDPDTVQTYFKVGADNISFIANDKIELTTNNLEINSTNFQVDSDGNLACSNADISGKITSTQGTIGGFTLSEWGFESNDHYLTITNPNSDWGSPYSRLYCGQIGRQHYGYGVGCDGIIAENWNTQTLDILKSNSTPNGGITLTAHTVVATSYKNRLVKTKDYGDRLLYSYETPSPMFGDLGEGQITNDGKCYVWLDPVFIQTIADTEYQVFLQKYGQGECWVSERTPNYFVVEGDIGLSFCWEIKARQENHNQFRLNEAREVGILEQTEYGTLATLHLEEIKREREVA
jgi:hypothetical protein